MGAGDPTLAVDRGDTYRGAARLDDLAAQVKQKLGTTRPTRVLVDPSVFTGSTLGPGWDSDIPTGGFGGPATALTIDGARTAPKQLDNGYSERFSKPDAAAALAFAKALGVNGGYVVGSETLVEYLRETSPFYIYSNPITAGEAAAASTALGILDSQLGRALLEHLRAMTERFENGLVELGYETLPGPHPVRPLLVRDTARAAGLVERLRAGGVLATVLNYPVVPRGDDTIRFQISADHTPSDIDDALELLASFPQG